MNKNSKYLILLVLISFPLVSLFYACSPVRTGKQLDDINKQKADKYSSKKGSKSGESSNKSKDQANTAKLSKNQQNENLDNIKQNNDEIDNSKTEKINLSNNKLKKNRSKNRNQDTTVINLEITPISIKDYAENFNNLVFDFDKEKYESSCEKFEEYSKVFSITDSLYFESIFFVAECNIVSESYLKAVDNFNIILNSKFAPDDVIQRALLRLGQVKCLLNKKDESEELFNRLKTDFPKSIYLRLANCNFNTEE